MSLTFRNVSGANTNAGTSALKTAGSLFTAALTSIGNINNKDKADDKIRKELLFQQGQEDRQRKIEANKVSSNRATTIFENSLLDRDKKAKDAELKIITDNIKKQELFDLTNLSNKVNNEKKLNPTDPVLTPKQQALEQQSVLTTAQENFPDAVLGSGDLTDNNSGSILDKIGGFFSNLLPGINVSGKAAGGTELQEVLANMLNKGVFVDGKRVPVSPSILESNLLNSSPNFGDTGLLSIDQAVNVQELRKNVIKDIKKAENRNNRSKDINSANQILQQNIKSNAGAAILKARNKIFNK